MGGAVLAIDQLRRATGAAVVAVHHTGRNGELPRGHSSLDGAADSMFLLKDEGGVRILEGTKPPRDGEPVATQRLRLVPAGTSCVIEPLEGALIGLGQTDRKLLQAHRNVSLDGETTSTTWIESSGVSKATYHRSLKRLIEGGYVVKRARRYALTPLGEAECLTVSR
jgi:hypothetical protein